MHTFTRDLVVAFACVALGACTTMKPVFDAGSPRALDAQVHAGDHVRITRVAGAPIEGSVVGVTPDRVDVASAKATESVRVDEIRGIERREASTGRTALLVLVVLGIAIAGVAAYGGATVTIPPVGG